MLNVLVNIEEETRHNEFPQIKNNTLLYRKKDRTGPDCFTKCNPTKHCTPEAKNARAENNPKNISPF